MIRLKCTVAYIGAHYNGWQSQKKGNSIQEILESTISRIENREVHIIGSGRTDAGVSARNQVFCFDTERDMSTRKWMGAMNAFLPDDIHIREVEEVTGTFHARYCVRWKKYTYRINDGPYDVFSKDYVFQCPVKLDDKKMKECAKLFVGTHDFTSFNSSPLSLYPDQVRTIFYINVKRTGNLVELEYCGKGFLRYMVRMLSAAIIDVGKGKLTVEDVRKTLEKKDKRASRRNAHANGLTLEEVDYFDVIAVNHLGQIREFIHSDALPYKEWNRTVIEKNARAKKGARVYLYCTRKEQKDLGYFLMTEENNLLVTSQENTEEITVSLKEQVQEYLAREGRNPEFETVSVNDCKEHAFLFRKMCENTEK